MNRPPRPTHVYIGRKYDCGCCMSIASDTVQGADDIEELRSLADFIADSIRGGNYIERVAFAYYREVVSKEPTFMKCSHQKPPKPYVGNDDGALWQVRAVMDREIDGNQSEVQLDVIAAGVNAKDALRVALQAKLNKPVTLDMTGDYYVATGSGEEGGYGYYVWLNEDETPMETAVVLLPAHRQMELRGVRPLFNLESV